jgi:hypothetical protein
VTTGSKTVSDLSSFVDYYGSTVYVGRTAFRSWSGSDYPASKPSYTNTYYPGTKPPRKVWVRPPKRSFVTEHPYSCSFETSTSSKVEYGITIPDPFGGPPQVTICRLSPRLSASATSSWTSNDDLKLRDKLREKIVGSDFNAGVAIAESSKSLSLITNSATRIYKALKALKRGDPASAAVILTRNTDQSGTFKPPRASKNARSQIGGLWLELQYGWMPLLKDAEAGAQALAHAFSVPPQQVYRASRRVADTISVSGNVGGYGVAFTQGTIKAIIREKNMPQLLGLMDPASIAWELMPYSFVVDWFVPIGTYLQNLALARGVEGTFVTTIYRKRFYRRDRILGAPNFPGPKDQGCQATLQFGDVTRTVSTSLSVPLPSVKSLDSALSPKRCMNAIALLTNLKFA